MCGSARQTNGRTPYVSVNSHDSNGLCEQVARHGIGRITRTLAGIATLIATESVRQTDGMPGPVDLLELVERIDGTDTTARAQAEQRHVALRQERGSVGDLEQLSIWLSATQGSCPPKPFTNARVIVFAADHGIASAARIGRANPEATVERLRALAQGRSLVNELARLSGATVRVVDVGVAAETLGLENQPSSLVSRWGLQPGSGSIESEDAMTREQVDDAFATGLQLAYDEVDAGADLLIIGSIGVGGSTVAAAVTGLYLQLDAASVAGRGTGIDDVTWMRRTEAIRDSMRRGRPLKGYTMGMLSAVGGADLIAMAGFLLGAAARRTPVLLDGAVSTTAALVAARIAYKSREWFMLGCGSTEPSVAFACEKLRLEPIVQSQLTVGDGSGGLLALPLLRAAQAVLREEDAAAAAAFDG